MKDFHEASTIAMASRLFLYIGRNFIDIGLPMYTWDDNREWLILQLGNKKYGTELTCKIHRHAIVKVFTEYEDEGYIEHYTFEIDSTFRSLPVAFTNTLRGIETDHREMVKSIQRRSLTTIIEKEVRQEYANRKSD